MLNEKQYKELCKYRDSAVPVSQTLDDITAYLAGQQFIVPQTFEYTVHQECAVTYQKSVWLLTLQGKLALEDFERNVREECAQRERDKASMKKQRFSNILEALAVATVSAIIAGVFLYYWPSIIFFFKNLFH